MLNQMEAEGDYSSRLALLEELKIHACQRRLGLLLQQQERAGGDGVHGCDQVLREKRGGNTKPISTMRNKKRSEA